MISHLTRASVRRLVALTPTGSRSELRSTLVQPELAGPLPLEDLERHLADYLLDPRGRPVLDEDLTWLARSQIMRMTGPACGVPIGDDVAAIIAAPRWVANDRLSESLLRARFAPRADEAIAAAVARLSADGAVAAIDALAATPGPDEAELHLALLQAGRALSWRPELSDRVGVHVDALLALLDRGSPQPLLHAVAASLGPVAASSARVRDAVLELLRAARQRIEGRRAAPSFLGELQALDRPRTIPDEDYYMTLPDRQVAAAAAELLGRSAERFGRDAFIGLRIDVLDGELGDALLPSFIDGLIAAAAVEPLGELVAQLLDSTDEETRSFGLHVAAQVPLDDCGERCVGCLDDRRASIRASAVLATAMLEAERAVPPLLARLDDPEAEVCARAARSLVDFGQTDRLAERQMPGELAVGKTRERTAAVRAALSPVTIDVASVLLARVAGQAELVDELRESPLLEALASALQRSTDGLQIAAAFVREIPEALPIVALALSDLDDDTTPVLIPAEARAELAAVLDPIIASGGEAGMIALETLARFSLGDREMSDRIVDAAAREDGYAQHILAALAHVRVRSENAATLLARWLDDREYLPATLLATGVAGVVVPVEHRLWQQIRELFALGTHAATAAYTALTNRHRIRGKM
ncbi:MAG: hypothetical protein ABI591_29650 [Kofleriaceae bacterium]